jgi:hypothetical protein
MTSLERFQEWFASQCDGDWEHGAGVAISTLDNPGWSVAIDIIGTPLEGQSFQLVRIERTENDWLHVASTGDRFTIYCGPRNLEEGLTFFCNWAKA